MEGQEVLASLGASTVITEEEEEKPETVSPKFEAYDEEDCGYMVRILENEAFSMVVSAFRAQGMLSDYKKILLEHLKAALFISDERYLAEIRQAANDQTLSHIAQTLSPSYDTYAQWGLEGLSAVPYVEDIAPQDDSEERDRLMAANELLQLAQAHNASLSNENAALQELIALPKAPYVPERLRLLLRETEDDHESRIGTLRPSEESNARASRMACSSTETKIVQPSASGQSISVSRNAEEVSEERNRNAQHQAMASTSTSSSGVPSSPSKPVLVNKGAVLLKSTHNEELDSNHSGDHMRPKKRRLRQRDLSASCARVLPFRFQAPAPGQKNKPIRGNPDRSPGQTSPLCISNLASTSSLTTSSSVISSHPQLTSPSGTFRTVLTNPTAVINSGRLHQVSHMNTSGMVIKRARAVSSGGNESVLEGTLSRQVSNTPSVYRVQQPVQRAFIRSSSGQRFYATPIASAYSSPTRPYYGNPNAVAGFMRPGSSCSPRSSYTISSAPSTSSTCYSQPQTITSSEIQRLVAHAAASGQPHQYRTYKKPPPRPVVVTSSARLSVTSQRQGASSSLIPSISVAEMTGANYSSQQQQQLAVHQPLRLPSRTLPSVAITSAQRPSSILASTMKDNTPAKSDTQVQSTGSSTIEMEHSDPHSLSTDSSAARDSSEVVEQERGSDMDRSLFELSSAECSSHAIHLDCDELIPRPHCLHSNCGSISNEGIPVLVSHHEENRIINRDARIISGQFTNGLIRQENQNVISYVSTPQCIQ
ncbi:unnamed protein product [Thelazia callipaeda]|uniref:ENT domain-containing protein n=1 Tax=Thelazia callipaeda TaxID=103827 RepID=A0A0N5CQ32_THECL|nr:unnamed protein product [Thelazia callipaeda]